VKNILTHIPICLFFGTLLLFTNTSYRQKEFSKLVNSTDTSYGYTAQNALRLKKGNQGKSIAYSYNFLSGLKTQDNQTLTLLFRATVDDPNYKQPAIKINNRFTGMPISGKLGLLDKYVFLTSNTKGTVKIFVDIYNKGTLMLPIGLKYEERQK
jgi:hypothetical protein